MALPIGALVTSLIEPFVKLFAKKLVEELAEDLTRRLPEKFKDFLKDREIKKLPDRISKAVMSGNTSQLSHELLEKEYMTGEGAHLVLILGELWSEAEKVSKILNEGTYYTEDIESLFTLAKLIKELTRKMSFYDLGIRYIVEDTQSGEEIEVVDENYQIALLLNFSGVAYTQLGKLETPEEKGQALEYDAEIRVVKSPPKIEVEELLAKALTFDEEYFKFEENFKKLWNLYGEVERVKQFYLKAVACFKAARSFISQARRQEQKHRRMQPMSLRALIANYMGETQFWIYNISPDLPSIVQELREVIKQETEKASTFISRIMVTMNLTDADIERFYRIVYIYEDFAAGYAGALQLFREAVKKYPIRRDLSTIQSRIGQCKEEISKHGGTEKPKIVVEEPDFIHIKDALFLF